jgi:hypothetical protein
MNEDPDKTGRSAPPSASWRLPRSTVASPFGVIAFSMLEMVRSAGVLLRRAVAALRSRTRTPQTRASGRNQEEGVHQNEVEGTTQRSGGPGVRRRKSLLDNRFQMNTSGGAPVAVFQPERICSLV